MRAPEFPTVAAALYAVCGVVDTPCPASVVVEVVVYLSAEAATVSEHAFCASFCCQLEAALYPARPSVGCEGDIWSGESWAGVGVLPVFIGVMIEKKCLVYQPDCLYLCM